MVTVMKPRQILLSCSSLSANGKPLSLTADQKPVLLQAVCLFLESNGFSKTLKKFLSEASIEKDSWKSCLLNLEDACCPKKKKKKGEKETTEIVEVVESEVALTQEKPSKKAKDKKKKKGSEPTPEPLSENLQTPSVEKEDKESTDPEKSSKPKSERKKNKDSKIDNDEVNADQDKKSSKKRKKSSSEENKIDDLKEESEVIKRRKSGGSGDEGTDEQVTKATNKDLEIDLLDNGGDKSALNKSSAKKENGSEPRTKNETFHRVKTDDVEFADDRLKDNSYWAKDGAEIGYGAKAQEVLGQVRGRDFRHEKTKKKRGSYRGGLIDLQSHSVKFNYSEEDE